METMYKQGQSLVIRSENEKIVIESWGKNTIRVRSVPMGEVLDTHYALLDKPEGFEPEINIETKELVTPRGPIVRTSASFVNGDVSVAVSEAQNGARLIISRKGEPILVEPEYSALHLFNRHFEPIPGGDYRLTVYFNANEGEKLFGMGQYQQENLNLKGTVLELAQRNSQASVPFVLSSLGYGFFWHNPAVGRASFATNTTLWEAQSTKQMDYLVYVGDTPAEIVQAYVASTGLPPMMPEYGLGFWQCKLRYWNQEQLLNVAREYHRRGLPLDVIVCDFFHWPYTGDFRFDYEFFPDPKAMVEELESMGTKLMCSIWPQVDRRSENYQELLKHGLLIRTSKGTNVASLGSDCTFQFIDATNPETRDYVWEKIKKNYHDIGVEMFWLDEAEPELDPYDFDNFRYYIGSVLEIGNIYPQYYSSMFYENQKKAGQEEIVNLVRCAWAGSQRYGALVWSGDIHSRFDIFRRQVCIGLNMGIAGIPWWTTDIGGFMGAEIHDPEFRELLVRWFQWGAFCPVMRLHGSRGDNTKPREQIVNKDGERKTGSGAENEIWSFGEENTPILADYILLRDRMRDYSRELMRITHETGAPVMRTMFYEFPQDAACWELKDQYMYGPDMLVAPVMTYGARERAVYLPQGEEWVNAWTGERFAGGQTVTAAAPIEQIPVFLRSGKHAEIFAK
ncbi:MAG: glycoside hydrolase family 31 protein [Oscillospiraceae bacterium]|nr:glycoside hydrolase family 31 protein [Oscillospiraceae bacterium]